MEKSRETRIGDQMKEVKKEIPETPITKFQKAIGVEPTGKLDKATKEAIEKGGKAIDKWAKEEIGDIEGFQKKNHMLITGKADYFTIERYLLF